MDRAFRTLTKRRRVQIEQFAIVNQRLKTVRESFGDQQALTVSGGKNFAMPAQKRGRPFSDIQGDIIHFAAQTTDQLSLCVRRILKMQAAYSPLLHGTGMIDLDNGFFPAGCLKFFCTKKATEESARISNRLALNDKKPRKRRRLKIKAAVRFHFQIFHLAIPLSQSRLRYSMSRRVSMHAQNPLCL